MKFDLDITKIAEEIIMQAKETQEEFIIETIHPYCEDILQIKINKEELKQILLNGIQKQQQRKNGVWLHPYKSDIACECSVCHRQMPITNDYNFCPACGANMRSEEKNDR